MSQVFAAVHVSASRLARLSPDKVRAIDVPLIAPARRAVTIRIDDIPTTAQFALVSMSKNQVCRAVTQALRSSTVRYGGQDFTLLRQHGLAERDPATIYHRLTEEGHSYARGAGVRIAKELGMHEVWYSGTTNDKRAHCTCGWTTSLYSSRICEASRFIERVQQHLVAVARNPNRVVQT